MNTPKKKKAKLTDEQQAKCVKFAQMFLGYARNSTATIVNMKTGDSQTPIEYANEFLADLGIEATFRPPPTERDIKTLAVFDLNGKQLPGRVSVRVEWATRRDPETPVRAFLDRGWWKQGGENASLVRVGAAS